MQIQPLYLIKNTVKQYNHKFCILMYFKNEFTPVMAELNWQRSLPQCIIIVIIIIYVLYKYNLFEAMYINSSY